MFAESNPARRLMFKQLNEALKTGGVGARIPIIQRAVEASNIATSQAIAGTRESQARGGYAGSPVAVQQLAALRMAGSQRASQIPTDIAQQLISAGPGLISSGSGIPGLASAASIQQSAANIGAQNVAATYGAGGEALGSLIGGIRYTPGTGFGYGGS